MSQTRQFQRWGWVIVGALAVFDAVMLNDSLLLRPGEHGILGRWVHAPWALALLLPGPLGHLWLLVVVALRGIERIEPERGHAEVSRALVLALVATIAVFHGLFWDSGRWAQRLLSLAR